MTVNVESVFGKKQVERLNKTQPPRRKQNPDSKKQKNQKLKFFQQGYFEYAQQKTCQINAGKSTIERGLHTRHQFYPEDCWQSNSKYAIPSADLSLKTPLLLPIQKREKKE
jgi:hypothetical protein